jgi:hypothetical protein
MLASRVDFSVRHRSVLSWAGHRGGYPAGAPAVRAPRRARNSRFLRQANACLRTRGKSCSAASRLPDSICDRMRVTTDMRSLLPNRQKVRGNAALIQIAVVRVGPTHRCAHESRVADGGQSHRIPVLQLSAGIGASATSRSQVFARANRIRSIDLGPMHRRL